MRKQQKNKLQDTDSPGLMEKVLQQLLEQISKRDQKIGWVSAEKTAIQRILTTQAAEREQALTAQLAEQERSLKAQIAEQERSFKAQMKEQERSLKEQMTEQERSLRLEMAEQEQNLQMLSSQLSEKEQNLQVLTSQLSEKEQIQASLKAQLASHSFELAEIKASKIWKMGLMVRRVRLAVFPPNGIQTRLARRVFNITVAPVIRLAKSIRSKRDLKLLLASDLFDAAWYLDKNPDIAQKNTDPALHYLHYGGFQGRDPGPLFSSSSYLSANSDVKESGINPLIHFIKFGRDEGRSGRPARAIIGDIPNKNSSYNPKVTIVVPNFNHASYLEKRLSSIYNQSYKNYEVLLLDDCSNDRSRKILQDYQSRYPLITRCLFNEENSGSAFAQWKKGIENAEGELVWIAESDDYCDLDFLEKLVPLFSDETVLLGYAHSVFVDENSQKHPFAFEHYLSELDRTKWDTSYIASAHNEVNSSLGLKNTIPNVSSVVFRKPGGVVPILNDPNWLKMKVCGDWLFYLNIIRGGRIAYCRETNNYYRIHRSSSSKKTHVQDVYYREHEVVACAIASLYNVTDELLFKNYLMLEKFFLNTVEGGDLQHFKSLFDLGRIREAKNKRTPNILMGVFAFSFGGGEVFPIRLANVIKEKGGSVIILNGNFEPTHPRVRGMIHPQIPVIHYDPMMNLDQVAKEYGIEITHSHHASMDRMLSVYINSKHVTTMHGMYEMMEDFLNNTREFIGQIDHWFYTAEKNVAPFRKYKIYSDEKFTKMDNGMRIPEIHQADLGQYGINENSFTICLATRALFDKGWFEAIESVTLARNSTGRDIHLLLIGEGPVYDKLKNTTLPDYIHLLGFKSNLVDFFAASQIGYLPSYFKGESFPLVMIECFMAEKPIIASKIGEIPDMITTADDRIGGALVNLYRGKVRAGDLASALVKMIDDEGYYQECADAVRVLKNKFDLDAIAEKYLAVYRDLCIRGDSES